MFRHIYRRREKNDITIKELTEMVNKLENVILLDVRSPEEHAEGHLKHSMNLPLYEIEKRIAKVVPDFNTVIIVYCKGGKRSRRAMEILQQKGYSNLYNLAGGLEGI